MLLSALLLGALSLTAISVRRSRPWLFVGWFWFLGVLVPFIGLVQAGEQALAERFMYLPLLGLLTALVWSAAPLATPWPRHACPWLGAAFAMVLLCAGLARRQTGYWKDSEVLFRHAVAVTQHNPLAHNNLGTALLTKGRIADAVAEFQAALQLKPGDIDLLNNLACVKAGKD